MSQDDSTPKPLRPSDRKGVVSLSPKASKFGKNKNAQNNEEGSGGEDTDFNDSAHDEDKEITEAQVSEMELSNRQLKDKAQATMKEMNGLVQNVLQLKA